jgi:putative membrane protein insertion efficiency factor
MKRLALKVIKLYQYTISRVTLSSCRYIPSCSHYACEAIEKYGLFRGFWLTVFRLIRCNPWSRGGYDPCP